MNKLSIKEWAVDDRPREKALRNGISSLSNAELLAILIGSGSSDESAIQLSQRILSSVENNLHSLGRLSLRDMISRFKGIGMAKGVTILAAMELGRRRAATDPIVRDIIRSSRDVYDLLFPLLADLPHEELWALFLNRSQRIIDKQKLSQGGIAETSFDMKLLLKHAINALASGIILCHNHPSGNLRPSHADDQLTRHVAQAVKLMDMQLLDHVIIADNRYYSYSDEHGCCPEGVHNEWRPY